MQRRHYFLKVEQRSRCSQGKEGNKVESVAEVGFMTWGDSEFRLNVFKTPTNTLNPSSEPCKRGATNYPIQEGVESWILEPEEDCRLQDSTMPHPSLAGCRWWHIPHPRESGESPPASAALIGWKSVTFLPEAWRSKTRKTEELIPSLTYEVIMNLR